MMEERDEVHEFARITGEDEMWTMYRKIRNKCTEAVKKDRKEYFGKMYDACETERDISRLYKTTRKQLGREESGPPVSFLIDGRRISAPKEMADVQVQYYFDKNKKLEAELIKDNSMDPTESLRRAREDYDSLRLEDEKLEIRQITMKETADIFGRLGNSTSRGHDNIDAVSLKLAAAELLKPIHFLIKLINREM